MLPAARGERRLSRRDPPLSRRPPARPARRAGRTRRRPARHAHGLLPGSRRARDRQRVAGEGARDDLRIRRGALRTADRTCDRPAPARRAVRAHADLVDTIRAAIPAPARFGEGHPAKRVFQALRIAVNDDVGLLEVALPAALAMLAPAAARGHLLPLARGPDRQALPPRARAWLHLPARLPGLRLRARARAPRDPTSAVPLSEAEVAVNPRAASARLRAAAKAE